MVKNTIYYNVHSSFVHGLYKPLKILFRSKAWINMVIIHYIVLMVFSCSEYRIQVKAVKSHILNMIQILCDPIQRSAQPCLNGNAVFQ